MLIGYDVVTSCIKRIIVHSCEAQKLIRGTKELLGDQINRIALIAGLHLERDSLHTIEGFLELLELNTALLHAITFTLSSEQCVYLAELQLGGYFVFQGKVVRSILDCYMLSTKAHFVA